MQTEPYLRRAYYYETDRMSIVHHSNYIRWMEEARLDLMRQSGYDYPAIERLGIIMPVVDVSCRYLHSVRYDEQVSIRAYLSRYNGIRAAFRYEMLLPDGTCAVTGTSSHCFLDEAGRFPVNLKRRAPEAHAAILSLLEETET